jgi:hypothetical protein
VETDGHGGHFGASIFPSRNPRTNMRIRANTHHNQRRSFFAVGLGSAVDSDAAFSVPQ